MSQFTPYQSRAMDLIKVDALRKDQQRQTRLDDLAFRKQDLAESDAERKRASEQDALIASTFGGVIGSVAQAPRERRREVLAAGLEAMEAQGLRLTEPYLLAANEFVIPNLDNDDQLAAFAGGLGAEVSRPSYNNPMAAVDPTTGEEVFIQAGSDGSVRPVEGFRPRPRSPATQVNVNTGEGGFKVPNGYMLKDPNDPSLGVTPIPGGPQDELDAGNAAKAQMLRSAQSVLPEIDARLFSEDGSPNRFNIANAAAGTPMTEGRELDRFYEVGIQAITRLETGAAMPPEEVNNTRRRFQPSPLDSDATIRAKRALFGEFLGGTLDLIDPSGRLKEDEFQNELDTRELIIEQGGGFSEVLGRMVTAAQIAAEAEAYGMSEEEVRAELGMP